MNTKLILTLIMTGMLLTSCTQFHDTSPTTRPAEIRRGMLMSGNHAQRSREYYRQLLARIEPSGHGDVHRLGVYLDFFKREFIRDPRLFAFNVTADADWARRVTLRGFIEFPEQRQALESLLTHLGFKIAHDEIEILPSKDLGELRYAIVTAPRAFLYDRTTGKRRETLTECLHDDALFLLKQADDGQFLCHAADGYVGYIGEDAIKRVDAKTLIGQQPKQTDSHAGEIEKAIATARTFLGTKYVWGGLTRKGIDCSGLVHASFASVGIDLARDADQQALTGRMVATRWCRGSLRAGDTLYFLSRRGTIHHTALYIGNGKFIEATEPRAKISSFDPASPDYSAKRDREFCFAKRILDRASSDSLDAPTTRGQVIVPKPPMVTPEQWGSKPQPIPDSRKQVPKLITIHHAGTFWKPGTDPAAMVRAVQVYGQKEKGWPDLPYHFMIAPDGRIFQARPLQYEPESNTKYPLNGHVGIELMGNFEVQRPSLAQLKNTVALVAWLCQDLHIDPSQIAGHKDRAKGQTVCPGKDFYRYLADGEFVGWVKQTLAGKTPNIKPGPALPDGPTIVIDTPTTQSDQ